MLFNEIVLNFRTNVGNVNGFRVLSSNDNATWQPAFSKFRPDQTLPASTDRRFRIVTARFVRVEIVLNNPTANFQLNELELYSFTPSLSRVFFTAADGRALAPAETITLSVGASVPLTLHGRLTNGQEVELENATVTTSSNKPAIASVTSTGADAAIAALGQGVALITAAASLDGVSRDVTLGFTASIRLRSWPSSPWRTRSWKSRSAGGGDRGGIGVSVAEGIRV